MSHLVLEFNQVPLKVCCMVKVATFYFSLWIRPSLCEDMLLGKGCHFFFGYRFKLVSLKVSCLVRLPHFFVWVHVSFSERCCLVKLPRFSLV